MSHRSLVFRNKNLNVKSELRMLMSNTEDRELFLEDCILMNRTTAKRRRLGKPRVNADVRQLLKREKDKAGIKKRSLVQSSF